MSARTCAPDARPTPIRPGVPVFGTDPAGRGGCAGRTVRPHRGRARAAAPFPSGRGRRVPGRGRRRGGRGDRPRRGPSGRGARAVPDRGRRTGTPTWSARRTPPGSPSPRSPTGRRLAHRRGHARRAWSSGAPCRRLPSPTCWPAHPGCLRSWCRPTTPDTGTVIRLADAAGADGVVVAGDAADPWNAKAIRACAGSLFHLPVVPARDPARWSTSSPPPGCRCWPRPVRPSWTRLGGGRRHPRPADGLAVRLRGAPAATPRSSAWPTSDPDPDLRARRVAEPGRGRRGVPVRQRHRAPPRGLTAGRDGPVG